MAVGVAGAWEAAREAWIYLDGAWRLAWRHALVPVERARIPLDDGHGPELRDADGAIVGALVAGVRQLTQDSGVIPGEWRLDVPHGPVYHWHFGSLESSRGEGGALTLGSEASLGEDTGMDPLTPGTLEQAAEIADTTDITTAPWLPTGAATDDATVAMVVRVPDDPGTTRILVSIQDGHNLAIHVRTDGTVDVVVDIDGTLQTVQSTATITDGDWHFVCATIHQYAGNTSVGLFVDQESTYGTWTGAPVDPATAAGYLLNAIGALGHVWTYRRALSFADAQKLWRYCAYASPGVFDDVPVYPRWQENMISPAGTRYAEFNHTPRPELESAPERCAATVDAIATGTAFDGAFSVGLWVQLKATIFGAVPPLVSLVTDQRVAIRCSVGYAGGIQMMLEVHDGSMAHEGAAYAPIDDTDHHQWHHLAWAFQPAIGAVPGAMRFFLDGELVGEVATTCTEVASGHDVWAEWCLCADMGTDRTVSAGRAADVSDLRLYSGVIDTAEAAAMAERSAEWGSGDECYLVHVAQGRDLFRYQSDIYAQGHALDDNPRPKQGTGYPGGWFEFDSNFAEAFEDFASCVPYDEAEGDEPSANPILFRRFGPRRHADLDGESQGIRTSTDEVAGLTLGGIIGTGYNLAHSVALQFWPDTLPTTAVWVWFGGTRYDLGAGSNYYSDVYYGLRLNPDGTLELVRHHRSMEVVYKFKDKVWPERWCRVAWRYYPSDLQYCEVWRDGSLDGIWPGHIQVGQGGWLNEATYAYDYEELNTAPMWIGRGPDMIHTVPDSPVRPGFQGWDLRRNNAAFYVLSSDNMVASKEVEGWRSTVAGRWMHAGRESAPRQYFAVNSTFSGGQECVGITQSPTWNVADGPGIDGDTTGVSITVSSSGHYFHGAADMATPTIEGWFAGWSTGDDIGILVDFGTRHVHVFLNGTEVGILPDPDDTATPWLIDPSRPVIPLVGGYATSGEVTLYNDETEYGDMASLGEMVAPYTGLTWNDADDQVFFDGAVRRFFAGETWLSDEQIADAQALPVPYLEIREEGASTWKDYADWIQWIYDGHIRFLIPPLSVGTHDIRVRRGDGSTSNVVQFRVIAANHEPGVIARPFVFDFKGKTLEQIADEWDCLHRQWGGVDGVDNVGVARRNVIPGEDGIVFRGNGDLYTGDVSGVDKFGAPYPLKIRGGAAIASHQYFGPGTFTVRAKVPPHVGHAFAIWLFHYEELYPEDFRYDDFGVDQQGSLYNGYYKVRNHEIDFPEIPSADADAADPYDATTDRVKFNTWIGELAGEYNINELDIGKHLQDGLPHDFALEWTTHEGTPTARFWIDDTLIHTIANDLVPDIAMKLTLGLWYPSTVNRWAGRIAAYDRVDMVVESVSYQPGPQAGRQVQQETYPRTGYAPFPVEFQPEEMPDTVWTLGRWGNLVADFDPSVIRHHETWNDDEVVTLRDGSSGRTMQVDPASVQRAVLDAGVGSVHMVDIDEVLMATIGDHATWAAVVPQPFEVWVVARWDAIEPRAAITGGSTACPLIGRDASMRFVAAHGIVPDATFSNAQMVSDVESTEAAVTSWQLYRLTIDGDHSSLWWTGDGWAQLAAGSVPASMPLAQWRMPGGQVAWRRLLAFQGPLTDDQATAMRRTLTAHYGIEET